MSTKFKKGREYARQQDEADPLKQYRQQFYIPQQDGQPRIYFCGNSLGLQPKNVNDHIQQELTDWQTLGVEGHFNAKNPWFYYHHYFTGSVSQIVGAKKEEVVVMNSLTTNLHLLMVSFYQPAGRRHKILIEEQAFPSDHYAVESQLQYHGYDPEQALIEVGPREGEKITRDDDILEAIEMHQDELALILIGGVNYYTGQVFDMASITTAGHKAGAFVGFDLAHAVGNIPLHLHEWEVDFAAWCTYKYLNSGPGAPGGAFVHEKHANNPDLLRFAGWWGYEESTRFEMKKGFVPQRGAAGWQLSNAPILGMAAHKAALQHFDNAGMRSLRKKSKQLTGYLLKLLQELAEQYKHLQIITPTAEESHGCQVSLIIKKEGKKIYDKLTEDGIVLDWREPEVLRLAPVPLYNTFEEVYEFCQCLRHQLQKFT